MRWVAADWKRPLPRVCFFAYRLPLQPVNVKQILELYVVEEQEAERILDGARRDGTADLFGRDVPLYTLRELIQ